MITLVKIFSVILALFIPLIWVFLCIRGTLKWILHNMWYAMLYAKEYYDEILGYILSKLIRAGR